MDPHIKRDIHLLSTEDLVVAYLLLGQAAKVASRRGDRGMAHEFEVRRRTVDEEIAKRQATFEDELARLREENQRLDSK